VYFDYVQRSCSSLYRLPRFINCPTYITYITLHYISPCPSQTGEGTAMKEEEWRESTCTFYHGNWSSDFLARCHSCHYQCFRHPLELIVSSATNKLLREETSVTFRSALRCQYPKHCQLQNMCHIIFLTKSAISIDQSINQSCRPMYVLIK